MKKINYKRFLHTEGCMPQTAACLIVGVNPDECIKINDSDWRDVSVFIIEANEITNIICSNGPWWFYKHLNIFDHVNKALYNGITVIKKLLAEAKIFFDSLVEQDQQKFVDSYPYIAKKLNLVNKTNSANAKKPVFTTVQRNKKWQETADQIIKEYPTWDKKSVVKETFERLKKDDSSYVQKKNGEYLDPESLDRIINMNRSHRK